MLYRIPRRLKVCSPDGYGVSNIEAARTTEHFLVVHRSLRDLEVRANQQRCQIRSTSIRLDVAHRLHLRPACCVRRRQGLRTRRAAAVHRNSQISQISHYDLLEHTYDPSTGAGPQLIAKIAIAMATADDKVQVPLHMAEHCKNPIVRTAFPWSGPGEEIAAAASCNGRRSTRSLVRTEQA